MSVLVSFGGLVSIGDTKQSRNEDGKGGHNVECQDAQADTSGSGCACRGCVSAVRDLIVRV